MHQSLVIYDYAITLTPRPPRPSVKFVFFLSAINNNHIEVNKWWTQHTYTSNFIRYFRKITFFPRSAPFSSPREQTFIIHPMLTSGTCACLTSGLYHRISPRSSHLKIFDVAFVSWFFHVFTKSFFDKHGRKGVIFLLEQK